MTDLSGPLHVIYRLLVDYGISDDFAKNINLVVNIIVLLIMIFFIDKTLRYLIVSFFLKISGKTRTNFDDYLFESKFPKHISHFIPLLIFHLFSKAIFKEYLLFSKISSKIQEIVFIIIVVLVVRSIIRTSKRYLKNIDYFRDKPLDSFSQVFVILFWIVGIIFIISTIIDLPVVKLLAGLGAVSAIIILIFKDTILGFVASIQVSMYDIVRLGDWITLDKFGADGTVIELNLTTVKVQNFDNTISTIPTYSLISDSLKNWRGMSNSKGRRIVKSIYIKQNSVKFLTLEDLKRFKKIQMLSSYIDHRQKDIDHYNKENNFDNKETKVNGRNQTNLGLFRKYCDLYLEQNPAINKEMIIMTRHLQTTPYGIPIEIYCFSKDKVWVNYERIMADIVEHFIASVSYFDLEIFELKNEDNTKMINS